MANNVNWADVIEEAKAGGGGSFENLPDGDYNLKVTDATALLTGNGKTMYKLETTVTDGPHANRKIWDNLVVSPDNGRAMGFFFRKMAALGLPIEFFQTAPTDEEVTGQLRGREFRAKVGLGAPYKDKISNEIKEYYPAVVPAFASAPQGFPAQQAAPQYQQQTPAPQAAPQGFPPAPAAPAQAPQYAPAPQAAPAPQFQQPAAPQGFPPAPQFQQQAPQAPAQAPAAPASPWEAQGAPQLPQAPF